LTPAGKPYQFAQTIERVGGKVTMPLFVKSLFSLTKKAKALAQSAKLKKELNFYQNEALILGSDATWRYLDALEDSLKARKRSIEKMYEDTKVKVESGRAPGIALDKMDESINRLDIAINDVAIKKTQVQSQIESLTGMELDAPVPFVQKSEVKSDEIFALKPLQYLLEAKEKGVRAAYDALYPKLALNAMWSENYSQRDVWQGDDVHRSYGNYTLGLSMPIFVKSDYTAIEQAKVDVMKEKFRLAKTKQQLEAQAKTLKRSLQLYKESISLAQKSVQNRNNLLAYAKVALQAGRLTEEEYLRYEEGLLDAQSKVFEAQMKRWQTMAQIAVIYGNDLKTIVE
jgi:outer membrane protein TolC